MKSIKDTFFAWSQPIAFVVQKWSEVQSHYLPTVDTYLSVLFWQKIFANYANAKSKSPFELLIRLHTIGMPRPHRGSQIDLNIGQTDYAIPNITWCYARIGHEKACQEYLWRETSYKRGRDWGILRATKLKLHFT